MTNVNSNLLSSFIFDISAIFNDKRLIQQVLEDLSSDGMSWWGQVGLRHSELVEPMKTA